MSISGFFDILRSTLSDGGPGFAQIAVTNACNANCGFCNFARDRGVKKAEAPARRLEAALDVLHGRGVRYVAFVGGEPLLYPGLDLAVSRAAGMGMKPVICTNGRLLTEERIKRLRDSGLSDVIISVDAPDDRVHDDNRGLPGLAGTIRKANRTLASLGMHSTASVTVSRLIEQPGLLPDYLHGLGFRDVTFSYPLTSLNSTYLSYSDSELVGFSDDELVERFGQLKALRKRIRVLNPSVGMDEMVRFIRKEPAVFPCLAGYKYFFLDWNLDVYRCHYMGEKICPVEEFADAEPVRDECAACMIDCYRDPSILQYCAVALSDSLADVRRGKPLMALRRMFSRRSYLSVRALVEQYGLILRYGER